MPESNERHIEKLLKAAQARRLEQAGTPEMHPALRETLQTEVRRTFKAPVRSVGTGWRGWLRFLPNVAVLLAVGVGVWLLVSREDQKIPRQLVMEQTSAAIAEAKDERLPSPEPLSASSQDRPRRELESEKGVVVPPAPAPATVTTTPAAVRSLPPAAPTPRPLAEANSRSVVGSDYFKAKPENMFSGTATTEAARSGALRSQEDAALAELMDTQVAAPQSAPVAKPAPAEERAEAVVLQNFTVLNQGDRVQFVDADGSTYEGQLQPVQGTLRATIPALGAPTANSSVATSDPFSPPAPDPAARLANFNVIVSGTNRSLGQVVQFTGNLSLTEEQLQLGRNLFSNTVISTAGRPAEQQRVKEGLPARGRLQGTAVLEDGIGVKVDAVGSTP